jgi:hypothetical protein
VRSVRFRVLLPFDPKARVVGSPQHWGSGLQRRTAVVAWMQAVTACVQQGMAQGGMVQQHSCGCVLTEACRRHVGGAFRQLPYLHSSLSLDVPRCYKTNLRRTGAREYMAAAAMSPSWQMYRINMVVTSMITSHRQ